MLCGVTNQHESYESHESHESHQCCDAVCSVHPGGDDDDDDDGDDGASIGSTGATLSFSIAVDSGKLKKMTEKERTALGRAVVEAIANNQMLELDAGDMKVVATVRSNTKAEVVVTFDANVRTRRHHPPLQSCAHPGLEHSSSSSSSATATADALARFRR